MSWVSVDDRLPEYVAHAGGIPFVTVLVTDGVGVFPGDYSNGKFFVFGDIIWSHVTHWMPYPDPPKTTEG